MKKQVIKMPVDIINKAIRIVTEVKEQYTRINAEVMKIPDVNPAIDGKAAVEKHDAKVKEYRDEMISISQKAEEKIKELIGQYKTAIEDQVVPRAEDITGDHAGDYMLLHDNLVRTPDQLRKIANAHQTTAFMIAVENYAERKGWNSNHEFSFNSAEGTVRDIGCTMLEQCISAVYAPDGLSSGMVTEPGELVRRVTEGNIIDEYDAGLNSVE